MRSRRETQSGELSEGASFGEKRQREKERGKRKEKKDPFYSAEDEDAKINLEIAAFNAE